MFNSPVALSVRRALLLSAVGAAVAGSATIAQAQDSAAGAESLELVTVTGTRIAKRDAEAESPILTVDAEAIVESGYTTVDQFMNTLPQVTPSSSSQSNNPSNNGRSVIDLRGLGSNRNLVLIDGRRGMGSTSGGVVDINTIPSALIERVEVITGGAGATYGADAVAGVVNFIMKKDFEGVAVSSQYRLTEQEDGQEWSTDLTLGGKFADDRGSAVLAFGYFKRDDMYKDSRAFAAQASGATATYPGGSYTAGANVPSAAAVNALFGPGSCAPNGGSGGFGFNPDGTLFCTGVAGSPLDVVGYKGPQSDIATAFFPDFFSYNFEPANILVLPMERWNVYGRLGLEVSDRFKPYAQFMYTNYNALQELAPTPAGGSTGFTVPVTNPFLTTQLRTLLASRPNPTAPFDLAKRFNALGGRTGFNTHDVWQLTTGATGDLVGTWTYDAYATYGRSVLNEIQGGNVRRDRTQALLNAADGGRSICAGGLNLFGSAEISQACRDYISLEAKNLTVIEQSVFEATASGDVMDVPAGKVQAAFGASYRDIDFDFRPDGGLQPGLVAGFNEQKPVSGVLNFTDVFTEVAVPLLADMSFVKSLSLTLGYRMTDNSRSGSDDTYKATFDWTATDSLRFRAGYQHSVRSPNISELFAPQLNNFPTFTNQDPCNTTGTIAATYRNGPNGAQVRTLCAAQSAVAGGATYVQPAGQANGIVGGNPDLIPEVADSLTLGFVLNQPITSLERSYLSVDYWSIDLEKVIASVGASTIVQRCFNRDGANPSFDPNNSWCKLFERSATNGGVERLKQLAQNQAFSTVSGVDLAGGVGFDLGESVGTLDLNLVATWTEKNESQTTAVDPAYDFVGTIGSTTGSSIPEWRLSFDTVYSRGPLKLQLTSRFIDSMVNAATVTGGSPITNTGVPGTWYYDLIGRYEITGNLTVRAGVNNLSDQSPRIYTPNVQANTDPSLYDLLGRRYYVGFDFRL
ncbi:MAG: TonB-dependent receptor domain-containing protein [Gammaproteobacteria bacterium]